MRKKIRVGVLFGGRSAEHEVSVISAKNIVEALDKDKYEVILIGIDKKGEWHLPQDASFLLDATVANAKLPENKDSLTVTPYQRSEQLIRTEKNLGQGIDVVFPALHGTYGEDGTIQGLLKLMDIPFVGASVLGSAVSMDKDVMKRLLRDAGLPIVKFLSFNSYEKDKYSFEAVKMELGLPFFVKPANLGSSIGVSKVHNKQEFRMAVSNAFQFDRKILCEEGLDVREIECSVLGNEEKIASVPGEIFSNHEFYDYDAKYIDDQGAKLQIPADLPSETAKEIQHLAVKACEVLCVDGMARVDFFLVKDTGKIYINEINTIPGFTNISMYPKLWEASGISYTEIIDRLIELAMERYDNEQSVLTSKVS